VTSRLAPAFARSRGRTGLIPFITVGYPSLEASLAMSLAFARSGALALELGVPFSDPIADGPDIQRASEWALRDGVGLAQVLELVTALRRESEIPAIAMTYANPVLRHGAERFASQASDAGLDGVLVSDLPPDEAPELWRCLDDAGLDTVTLVAPTTDAERLPLLIARCRGFLYCLSRTGVTGRAAGFSGSVPERIAALRALTPLPIAVGFGISTADVAAALRGVADAVVVGAAFMRAVTEDPKRGAVERVSALAGQLVAALR